MLSRRIAPAALAFPTSLSATGTVALRSIRAPATAAPRSPTASSMTGRARRCWCRSKARRPPQVTTLETGSFSWNTLALDLLEGDDAVAGMEALLPEARLRRRALVRLVVGGRARIEARATLVAAVERARLDFAHLEFDDAALATECEAADLDAIDRAGALREAADALLAEAGDAARSAEEREIARAALGRLYAYAQSVAP